MEPPVSPNTRNPLHYSGHIRPTIARRGLTQRTGIVNCAVGAANVVARRRFAPSVVHSKKGRDWSVRKFHCAVVSILALAVVVLAAATTDASAARKRVVVRKPAPVPAAAPASAPITAHGPDLIVLPDQTILTVNAKGCDVNEELFGGTVGVKNQGDGRADRLIVEPIVTVWIPEMLDMLDNKLVPNSLAPLEIF